MIRHLALLIAGFGTITSHAFAGPNTNIAVQLTVPSGIYVYQNAVYTATVSNTSNHAANNVVLTINLPATHTLPQVYVLGTLQSFSPLCTRSGTVLTCGLGTVPRNSSAAVQFALGLPENEVQLTLNASASTSEVQLGDNSATLSPTLLNYGNLLATATPVVNELCTGTNLTSFYECTLFPGSLSFFNSTLNGDGSITVDSPEADGYVGSWWQNDSQHLHMEFSLDGDVVSLIDAYGVPNGCFEGVMHHLGDSHVSPYRICP